jgi:hypothetical protein
LARRENYRTLVGDLRHESGHYFWGSNTGNYPEALQVHYTKGPEQNWQQNYISRYAAAPPWEDFAETWAHYSHIVDTLEMAFAFGTRIRPGVDE